MIQTFMVGFSSLTFEKQDKKGSGNHEARIKAFVVRFGIRKFLNF